MNALGVQRADRSHWNTYAAGALALLFIMLFGLWWQRQLSSSTGLAGQLQAAIDRGKALRSEIDAFKPGEAASCPPGTSIKTIASDAVLPSTSASGAMLPDTASGVASGAVAPAASQPILADASAAVLPDYALANKLEQATALVVVDRGKTLASGTAFFITPQLLLTNRHVIDHATDTNMLVISAALGKPRRAKVISATEISKVGSIDFALLKIIDGTGSGVLSISTSVGKLNSVVAAGYPDVIMEEDTGFQRLLRGDMSTPPELNMTQGTVQSLISNPEDGTPVIVHTASINHGNSGGPLIDACGRVVGINTYISVDKQQATKTNHAIRGVSIDEFLRASGASVPAADARLCGLR